MHVLYPSDFFSPKIPDEQFRAEAEAFAGAGVAFSVVDTDQLNSAPATPALPVHSEVLYRGWMLNAGNYERLVALIEESGAHPVTDSAAYLRTHHIPNWCEILSGLTPETVVLPLGSDFESELRALNWPAFFVKDFVKSLKTSMGSRISDPGQIGALIKEMEKYRGEIEGGLCVRRVEDLEPDSEARYFVVNGVPYSHDAGPIPELVSEVAARIDSRFFSVDVAQRSDGVDCVVEIGDGQVSDLVGWSVDRFVEVVARAA